MERVNRALGKTYGLFFKKKNNQPSLVSKIILYLLLLSISYVFLYPVLYMLVMSIETMDDMLNPAVEWIPSVVTLENYVEALAVMDLKTTLWPTVQVSLFPAILQTFTCMLTGYGIARFNFPGKKLIIGGTVLTFVIPFYATMVPTYLMYVNAGIVGTIWTMLLPAALGQGIFSAIFVLIFQSFFSQLPRSLDEAARVDGAGETRIFFGVAVPLSIPTILTTFMFSFVWYWNDTYRNSLFMTDPSNISEGGLTTLLIRLTNFEESYLRLAGLEVGDLKVNQFIQSEAVTMAGTMICIFPLLVVYFLLQRNFKESIEHTGITGE